MNVPTVNVVMSTDPADVFTFLGTETLDIFLSESKGIKTNNTKVFNNGPASNFLSLKHEVGMGEKGEPRLTLEFIDPQEVFERRMGSFTVEGMLDPKTQTASFQIQKLKKKVKDVEVVLQKKEEELIQKQKENRKSSSDKSFDALEKEIETLEEALEQAEDELDDAVDTSWFFDGGAIDEEDVAQEDDEAKKAIRAFNAQLLNQSVWISYGIGDKLENWCPPMVFGKAVGAEYDIGANNPRVLRLVYSGLEATPGGAVPTEILKQLGRRVICTGRSYRLFNEEAMKQRDDFYSSLNTGNIEIPYFKDYLKYSIHDVIVQVLTDYIQKATNRENVLVLLPDCDKYLKKLRDEKIEEAQSYDSVQFFTDDEMIELGNYLESARLLFEDLGMKVTESVEGMQSVNDNVFSELENECNSPSDMVAHLKSKTVRVVLSSNIESESYEQALEKVFMAIKRGAEKLLGSEGFVAEDYQPAGYVVNDYIMLQALSRKGLIDNPNEPLYVFGSRKFIEDFLFGYVAFRTETGSSAFSQIKGEKVSTASVPTHITGELNSRVSPLDIIKGLDEIYIKTMAFYQEPNLAYSPFGFPAVQVEPQNEDLSDQPVNDFTMPIFSMGTRNANILDLKLDFNKQFLTALIATNPIKESFNQKIQGILDDTDAEEAATNLVTDFADLDLGSLKSEIENGAGPNFEKFKKLVDPLKDSGEGWFGTDREDDDTFDAMLEIFQDINEGFAKELEQAASEDTENDSFYNTMYDLLGKFVNDYPKQDEIEPFDYNGKGAISKLAEMKKFLNRVAIVGTVKTLPLFQLSNLKRVTNKPCYVYANEPRFQGVHLPYPRTGPPFYSGFYQIKGFRHSISKGNVFSEFSIHRSGK